MVLPLLAAQGEPWPKVLQHMVVLGVLLEASVLAER
jgi:hypothetical protein